MEVVVSRAAPEGTQSSLGRRVKLWKCLPTWVLQRSYRGGHRILYTHPALDTVGEHQELAKNQAPTSAGIAQTVSKEAQRVSPIGTTLPPVVITKGLESSCPSSFRLFRLRPLEM